MVVSALHVAGVRWAYLDQVLAFRLCDERLKLGGGECIDETRFRDDQEKNLSAGKDREFVCLTDDLV